MGKSSKRALKGSRKSAKRERIPGLVNNYVARRLRQLRLEQGKTCQQVARRIGIPAASYSGLENGWYRISLDKLFGILQALGVEVVEVWPLAPPRANPGGNGSVDGVVAQATRRPPALAVQDVLEAVSEAFQVPLDELASASRWSRLQEARAACAILVREISGLRFRSLARQLRRRESALGQLERRFRKQAKRDRHLSVRIQSARLLLRERRRRSQSEGIHPLSVRRLS